MLYEYQCKKCELIAEREFSMAETKPKIKCGCGAWAHKVILSPSIYYQANFFTLRKSKGN